VCTKKACTEKACTEKACLEKTCPRNLSREVSPEKPMAVPGSVTQGNVTWPKSFLEMAGWTRAIVRLEGWNRMVTKGYQKGVYERVTFGIGVERPVAPNTKALCGGSSGRV
jgi:hypothetical protein